MGTLPPIGQSHEIRGKMGVKDAIFQACLLRRKSRNDCEHFFLAGMIAEVNFLKIFGCCFFGDSYRIGVPSVNGIFGVFFQ